MKCTISLTLEKEEMINLLQIKTWRMQATVKSTYAITSVLPFARLIC